MTGASSPHARRVPALGQAGGVMVFVAASLVVLVLFLAYVIDLGALVLANERARQYARFAAMAAIEGYFSKICSEGEDCYQERLVAAKSRANDVSERNALFNTENTLQVELSENWNSAGGKAKLVAGKWWTAPPSSEENPCDDGYPCFIPASGPESINAFRVEEVGNAFGGGIAGFFSGFFGNNLLKLSAAATATIVPRRAMVIVDVSHSTTRETHLFQDADLPPEGNGAKRSKYAFLAGDAPHQLIFDQLDPKRGTAGTDRTIHYQDDYANITPYSDNDYNTVAQSSLHPDPSVESFYSYGTPPGSSYRIDAFRDSEYTGPQPLQTILEGVNHLVSIFNERAVAGDKLGVIFYDERLLWPRVVKPTNNFNYIRGLLENSPTSGGNTLLPSDIDTTDDSIPFVKAAKHWIFPRKGSMTNTQLAIMAGLSLLYQDQELNPGIVTSDFLVNISDGRSVCYPANVNSSGTPTTPYYDPQQADTNWSGIPGWRCANDYPGYRDSMKALHAYLDDLNESTTGSFRKLPVHTILVGRDSGPNTRDIVKSAAGVEPPECYTDSEIRRIPGLSDRAVKGSDIDPSNEEEWEEAFAGLSSDPFYEASYQMFKIAIKSGGLWLPIRPQTDSEGSCANPACNPGESCPGLPCVDGATRDLDPKCRSVEQQIKDGMGEIMGQSPYAIVEVD